MPKKQLNSAQCGHTKRGVIIKMDPAKLPERDIITVTFHCRECGSEREFVGNHVKLKEEESTCGASITDDSGWQIPEARWKATHPKLEHSRDQASSLGSF
jgi:hypothetical protein